MLDVALAYERYAPEMRAFVQHSGYTREEAEDIVQDAFIKAMRVHYEECGRLRGWLFQILRCKIIDAWRARRSVSPMDDSAYDADFGIAEARAEIGLIPGLTTEQRRALLACLAGHERDTAAPLLGTTPGAYATLLYRARQAARKAVDYER